MDNIFGIGLPEFILILIIAGMVMGPERIARTARSLGLLTARLQNISRSFLRQLNAELDSVDETGEIKSTVEELDKLRRQVSELRNEVFTLAAGTAGDGRKAINTLKREVENSILPPFTPNERQTPVQPQSGRAGEGAEVLGQADIVTSDFPIPNGDSAGLPAISRAVILPKRVVVSEDPDE